MHQTDEYDKVITNTTTDASFQQLHESNINRRITIGHAARQDRRPAVRRRSCASANTEHPQSLAAGGRNSPVVVFARNRPGALVETGPVRHAGDVACDHMLREDVKVSISTPKADPAGDYALAVFARAEAVKAGSRKIWSRRRCGSPAGRRSAAGPAGRSVYGWHVAEDVPTSSSPIAPVH